MSTVASSACWYCSNSQLCRKLEAVSIVGFALPTCYCCASSTQVTNKVSNYLWLQFWHRATCPTLSEPSFAAACKIAASASQVARSKSAAVWPVYNGSRWLRVRAKSGKTYFHDWHHLLSKACHLFCCCGNPSWRSCGWWMTACCWGCTTAPQAMPHHPKSLTRWTPTCDSNSCIALQRGMQSILLELNRAKRRCCCTITASWVARNTSACIWPVHSSGWCSWMWTDILS